MTVVYYYLVFITHAFGPDARVPFTGWLGDEKSGGKTRQKGGDQIWQ